MKRMLNNVCSFFFSNEINKWILSSSYFNQTVHHTNVCRLIR